MIVRVVRTRVRAGRVGLFNALIRRQLALLRAQPGLKYVRLARRLQPDGGQEAVLFEEWDNAGSLYAWVGPDLHEARLIDGVRDLVDEIHVAHYEALAEDHDLPDAPAEPADGAERLRSGEAAG